MIFFWIVSSPKLKKNIILFFGMSYEIMLDTANIEEIKSVNEMEKLSAG